MSQVTTYSFKDTQLSIVGVGGSFSIGADDAGVSGEGITVEFLEDKDTMTTGADGSVMHTLNASNAGAITVRLLKTSPINAKLSTMFNIQKASSAAWGLNVLSLANPISGDQFTLTQAAFKKFPNVGYAKEGPTNEWRFEGKLAPSLGGGLAENLASTLITNG